MRLAAAFSPRRGLRALVAAPSGRLLPLDGLRALSVLWVVSFHALWYLVGHLPPGRYLGLVAARALLPLWRGDFAVDAFFVLSGFLIGGLLIDELVRSGRVQIGRFYLRRLLRLWPALLVALLVDQLAFGDFSTQAWAPALYLTNARSVAEVPMAWTWSLSIEEQFYLICPWLLVLVAKGSTTRRLLAILGLGLLLIALGAWVVARGGFTAVDVELAVNRDPLRWIRAHDTLYSKPWMRAGPLLAGVAAAIAYRSPRVMQRLGRAQAGAAVGLGLALLTAVAATHWPLVAGAPRSLEIGYLASFRSLFGVAIAFLLLLSVSAQPLGRALGRLLSRAVWRPFAQLAYSAYLVNPIVTMLLYPVLIPRMPASDATMMLVLIPIVIASSFLAALPLYLFVERPFMELRPAASSSH